MNPGDSQQGLSEMADDIKAIRHTNECIVALLKAFFGSGEDPNTSDKLVYTKYKSKRKPHKPLSAY
jgi:hypothetical protein